MKIPMVSSATSFQRVQTSLQSPMPRLPRSNVYSTRDPANPSASVHRKRFFTPSLTLKFLCAGYLNSGLILLMPKLKKSKDSHARRVGNGALLGVSAWAKSRGAHSASKTRVNALLPTLSGRAKRFCPPYETWAHRCRGEPH